MLWEEQDTEDPLTSGHLWTSEPRLYDEVNRVGGAAESPAAHHGGGHDDDQLCYDTQCMFLYSRQEQAQGQLKTTAWEVHV